MQHKHEYYRGTCDHCGLVDPDYEPDDNEMPSLAAVTDPWESSGNVT